MPPRHAYWTILVDDQPTAFRAHDADELLPTLNRLREKNPSAVMKWFERGQLFDSRDAARDAGMGRGERRWEGPRPDRPPDTGRGDHSGGERGARGPGARPRGAGDTRDRDWRPGGDHRDPRQKYRDAKKAKWTRFKQNIRANQERRAQREEEFPPETYSPPHGDPLRDRPRETDDHRSEDRRGAPTRPHGDALRPRPPRREWQRDAPDTRHGERDERERSRPPRDRERGPSPQDRARSQSARGGFDDRRDEWRPKGPPRDRAGGGTSTGRKPWGGKPGGPGGRRPWDEKPAGEGERRPWSSKPPSGGGRRPWGSRPAAGGERRPWSGKPAAGGDRRPWGSKPAAEGERRPWGGKPGGQGGRGSSTRPAGAPGRRPWGGKPAGGGGARKPWAAKPGGPPRKRRKDDDE